MNPWLEVRELRWQYQHRIAEELEAHEAFLASGEAEAKYIAWRAVMERKGAAFRAYKRAVEDALKSGTPFPE
jgi:hypothetical protein